MHKQELIFGIHAIRETVQAGKTISKVLIQSDKANTYGALLPLLKQYHIPFSMVPKQKLQKLTRLPHQGVLAWISPIDFAPLNYILPKVYEKGQMPLVLILDKVTDVGNFGAIVRTAAAANVDAVIIPEQGSALISMDAMKASAGALAHVPICREPNLKHTIDYLKASGIQILACKEKSPTSLYSLSLQGPLGIILGNESTGISPEYLGLADQIIGLPTPGPIDCLNVSCAAAITIYEILRQRLLN